MDASFVIIYPLQFIYALGATLFLFVIPIKLFLPEKYFPPKAVIPSWLILSAIIAIFTTTSPPKNPDPYNCRETKSGLLCN